MTQFRRQFTPAHRGYQGCRYNGSLADDIGLRDRGASSHSHRWVGARWLIALAAMIAVVILLRHGNEPVQTITVPAAKVVDSGAAHLSGRRRGIEVSTTATPATQPIAAESTDVTPAMVLSSPSLSFESITNWPSVSADFPSLGGLTWPELNTQSSQSPTTQESSS